MRRIMLAMSPERAKLALEGRLKDAILKTFPKCDLPCEVFICVTKGKDILLAYEEYDRDSMSYYGTRYELITRNPLVDGRKPPKKDDEDYSFYEACREMYRHYSKEFKEEEGGHERILNGKVVARFTLNRIDELRPFFHWCEESQKRACMTRDEALDYLDDKDRSVGNPRRQGSVHAWRIDGLRALDEPKNPDDFAVCRERGRKCRQRFADYPCRKCVSMDLLTEAPKGWRYLSKED